MGEGISALDWTKGILLSIAASIIGGASKLAIRKSWLLEVESNHGQRADENPLRSEEIEREQIFDGRPNNLDFFPRLLRYSGMFGMSVLNPICCVLAMNYASPSILAPFSGLTLVWVILFSPLVNNEKPSSRQVLACCFIISGEVIVAMFGDHTNDDDVTVEEVQTSYAKPQFILYFAGLILYLVLLTYWINFSDNFALRRFGWGSSGGAITGAQNFLKDSLTVIKATDQGQRLPLIFYPLSLLAGVTAFLGLLLLTACMKRYDATYSSASFVGSFVVSASLMAAVHYDTFSQLDGFLNFVLYPLGLGVLMIGVYLLSSESVECLIQQDGNNNDEVNFETEGFEYTEVEDERREETLS